jgi:rRNA-processing protein FCF1
MMDDKRVLQQDLEKETGIALTNNFRAELAAFVNHLINTDFEKLVFLLYRIDVRESVIKQLLALPPNSNAGELIADAIIARQAEKIESRKQFKQPDDIIAEEDKW